MGNFTGLGSLLSPELFTFSQATFGSWTSGELVVSASEKIEGRFFQTEANSYGTTLNFFLLKCFGLKRNFGATFLMVIRRLEMKGSSAPLTGFFCFFLLTTYS